MGNSMMISGTMLKERYQIKDTIGFGGFSTTYRALDVQTNEIVAVKECRNIQQKDMEKISREAQILRELSVCPGIVRIRDYIEEFDGAAYIVMDYVEGITLKAHVERHGNLSMKQVLDLMKPVMESLVQVHEKGLLHRDISPDNLMLQPDGTLKLLDFGAARNVSDENEKTMTMVLKPGYAPEEQYRSMSAQGTWTDVYALCATIYFCITGKAPVDSLQRMYEDVLKKPSELRAQISPQEESVLMHGLALRSENRIRTIGELLEHMSNTTKSDYAQPNVTEPNVIQQNVIGPNVVQPNVTQPSTNKMKRGFQPSKGILLAIAAVLFLLIAGVFIVMKNMEASDDDLKGSYIYFSDQEITQKEINELKKNKELLDISFSSCSISDEILEKITTLSLVEGLSFSDCVGFSSLEPLAKMNNLTDISYSIYEQGVSFDGNEIFPVDYDYVTDFSLYISEMEQGTEYLSHFKNLSSLSIAGSSSEDDGTVLQMNSIDFVKYMPVLTYISLRSMNLRTDDISPLANCPELDTVILNEMEITNIDGLQECEKLSLLDVEDNQITTLEPLSELHELKSVYVSNNRLSSLEGLENSTKMWSLHASQNELTDLKPIRDIEALEVLYVGENQLTSLIDCENLIELTELNANLNQITDLSGIESSTSLSVLRVKDNQITSLSLLRDRYPELNHLDVAGNKISDLSPIENCEQLQIVRADRNLLTSLRGLENKAELYAVSACENQISDIGAIAASPQLYYVDLAHNKLRDLKALEGLEVDEKVLFLEDNEIVDLSPLPIEGTYRCICVYGNPISNYEMIEKFLVETVYLPDVGNKEYENLSKNETVTINFVDVEKRRQAEIKRFFENSAEVNMMTSEEADEDIQYIRDLVLLD